MTSTPSIDELFLAIRGHTIHDGPVWLQAHLPSFDAGAVPRFAVRVFRESDGVVLHEAGGESLAIAASKVLRACNELRDAQVLALRRQVAKLTGEPEVVA